MPVGKCEALVTSRGRVILCDTITALDAGDTGAIVVTGSHGGSSAAAFALAVPLSLVVFNDAGVGKDRAGIVALDRLQARGVAAAAVSHLSARIGDAEETWRHGVVSHVNAAARDWGLRIGDLISVAISRVVA